MNKAVFLIVLGMAGLFIISLLVDPIFIGKAICLIGGVIAVVDYYLKNEDLREIVREWIL